MSSATMTITAEELERMTLGEQRVELVRGEVITMAPAGAEHGEIAGFTFGVLFQFVRAHGLGSLYAAETGFVLARNPDTGACAGCGVRRGGTGGAAARTHRVL